MESFYNEFGGARGMLVLLLFAWFTAMTYFLPLIVAGVRRTAMTFWIGILNLLMGWTVVGWVAAFVWACVGTRREKDYE